MNAVLAVAGVVLLGLAVRMLLKARAGIAPAAAHAAVRAGAAVLVDVREPPEWRSGVAGPAALLPLSDLRGGRRSWEAFLRANRDRRIILYCASGLRSGLAAAQLRREGHDAVNLGSLGRWCAAGLPVRRP